MKKLVGSIICMIVLLIPTNIRAEEEKDKTHVLISFAVTANDRFTYEVRVSDGGCLYDGSQKITNGTMAYELSVGQSKKFVVQPDKGYEVKKIEINGVAQDTDIREIEIAGVSATSILEVRYGRIEESEKPVPPDGGEGEIPDTPDNIDTPNTPDGNQGMEPVLDTNKGNGIEGLSPITGDMLRISEYVCLMLIVLYRIYVSKRDIDTCIRVDNIAISKDIEKKEKTLKEEKKNEK